MLTIKDLSYTHPSKELLFKNISLVVNPSEKIALIGNNGTGKSTLLKIIAGKLEPTAGTLTVDTQPLYLPQVVGHYHHLTIAEALGIDKKLKALHEILSGNISEENYATIDNDWTIEARCDEALQYWQLDCPDLWQSIGTLSGGQLTKLFLAGIMIHEPDLILMDEPSNHLDMVGRKLLYDYVDNSKQTMVIVSHDRKLLNLLETVCEMDKNGISVYGGNYDFYSAQKALEANALVQNIQNKQKALKKAQVKERETLERQQKSDSRGKKNAVKAGLPKIAANTLRNNAQRSTAKLASVHNEKTGGIRQELQDLRSALPDTDQMKFGFDNSSLHKGKILFKATEINFSYTGRRHLWEHNLNVEVLSGERIAIKGLNGSGKTTLIKLIIGTLEPTRGTVFRAASQPVYIDQQYSLIDDRMDVYDQAQKFNTSTLQEHEVKIRLKRFLFTKESWDKPCSALSGGERMRLMLCCLSIGQKAPDMIILDEPTNNLDIRNIEILTQALSEYSGTLVVISHDETFMKQVGIEREISL